MTGKQETIIQTAGDLLGCPYVYGAWGATCTTKLRKKYAALRPSQAAITFKRCQQLRPSNPKSSCTGCKYQGKLAFDCRGFVHYVLKAAGIEISGQAVGTQWTGKNWAEKGDIGAMPDLIAAVFIKSDGKWKHVGLHLGGGKIIHCSGEVKEDVVSGERSWTHYAIPLGLYTAEEIAEAHKKRGKFMRIMKKGCQGEDVRALQQMLNSLGFVCGKADGIYGTNTEATVKAFQAMSGIKADGIAGPDTLAILAARAADPDQPAPAPDTEPEDEGEAVTVSREELEAMIAKLDALREQLDGMALIARGWIE